METLQGDNPITPATELLQTQGGDRTDSRQITEGSDRFTTWAINRLRQGKNCLIVITGELGIGKSYMGLSLCNYFDPDFSVEKVVFLGSDFMKVVKGAKYGSWVLFDEPNLAIGHRSFMNLVNQTVAKFVQASRFLGINAIFALPSADLMDTAVVRVAHARIHVTDRGFGKVELIRHNQYQGGPRVRFPRLCTVRVAKPGIALVHEYEAKRKEFHSGFFKEDILAEKERESMAAPRRHLEDYVEQITRTPEAFFDDKGRLSNKAIAGYFGISPATASGVKARVEFLSSRKQPIDQS